MASSGSNIRQVTIPVTENGNKNDKLEDLAGVGKEEEDKESIKWMLGEYERLASCILEGIAYGDLKKKYCNMLLLKETFDVFGIEVQYKILRILNPKQRGELLTFLLYKRGVCYGTQLLKEFKGLETESIGQEVEWTDKIAKQHYDVVLEKLQVEPTLKVVVEPSLEAVIESTDGNTAMQRLRDLVRD
jgi:hypothetical protein